MQQSIGDFTLGDLVTAIGDVEFSVFAEAIDEEQPATDGPLPEGTHDFRVDYIGTPVEIIECHVAPRRGEWIWENLASAMIAAIPALAVRIGS